MQLHMSTRSCHNVQTAFQPGPNSSSNPGMASASVDWAGLKTEDKTLVHQVHASFTLMQLASHV